MTNQTNNRRTVPDRALDLLLLANTAAIVVVYALRHISDSDLWHHLRCGEYFARTGSLLNTFHFNCSAPDDAWLNHEWLFQAIVYGLEKLGGESALMALQVLLILAALLILYKTLRLFSNNQALIALVIGLGAAASSHRFNLRPEHFSYVFVAYFLYALHQFQRGRTRYVYAFPLLMLLWVNLHLEWVLGLVIAGGFLAVEAVRDKPGPASATDRDLRLLTFVLALTALASLANPFGYRAVLWPLTVLQEMRRGVDELAPPASVRFLFFWLYCLLALGAVVRVGLARSRCVDPVWVAIGLVFGVFAWYANRGIPYCFLATAPAIVAALDGSATALARRARVWVGLRLGVLSAMAALVLSVIASPAYLKPYDNVPYPEGALAFLERERIQGNVFNEHLWGGFLLWKGQPALRPYIDGRFYRKSSFAQFQAIREGTPDCLEVLDRHHITIVMLTYLESDRSHLGDLLFARPDWSLVYWDDVSLVFLKHTEAHQAALTAFGNRVAHPERQFLFQYDGVPAPAVKRARDIMEANLQNAPSSFRALIMAGNAHLALGDFDRAAARFESALAHLDPANAWIFYKLGFCYAQLGAWDKAARYLEQCVNLAPRYDPGVQLLDTVRSRQKS